MKMALSKKPQLLAFDTEHGSGTPLRSEWAGRAQHDDSLKIRV